MITKYETKTLKLNSALRGRPKGALVRIRVETKSGLPQDRYWRNRVKDSEIDGCVEYFETKPEVVSFEPEKKKKGGKK